MDPKQSLMLIFIMQQKNVSEKALKKDARKHLFSFWL